MSFAFLCMTGIISLLIAVFCILLIYLTTNVRLGDGSIFAFLIAALLVIPLILNERANYRRKQCLGNLRTVYEQSYSGERVFSFDEKSWVLQTRSGRQEVAWSSALSATDSANTVTVFCPDQLVLILPKRVFTSEEIQSLKRYVIGENNGFQSKIGLLDYVWSQAPNLWRRRPVLMIILHAIGLSFPLFLMTYVRAGSASAASLGWTFCGGLFLVIATLQFWYLVLKYEDSARYFFDGWRVQFSEGGVHIRAKQWESFTSWSLFPAITEGLRCFVLQTAAPEVYVVAEKCAPPEQQAEFRRHLMSPVSAQKSKQPDPRLSS